jgi:Outer membrane protein beta-barrel domain
MKKIIVSTFLLGCSMILVTGQESSVKDISKFSLGVYGGLNIPRLTGGSGNPLSEGWSSRAGGAFGMTFTLNISTNFALSADLLYSSEGGQRNGMQAFDGTSFNPQVPAGTYFYANYNNESILNYLEVPIMAKYSISLGKSSRIYLDLGPYGGYLLNANQKTSGSSVVYSDPAGTQPISVDPQSGQPFQVAFYATTNIKNQIHNMNFGLTGGLGLTQSIGFGEVILNFRGAYGLINIQKNSQDGQNHTGNLLVSLGYSIPL